MSRRAIHWVRETFGGEDSVWGDRLDLQIPAVGASLIFHTALVVVLAMVGYAAHTEASRAIQAEMVMGDLPDLSKLDTTELIETDRATTLENVSGSFAPRMTALVAPPPSTDEMMTLAVDAPSATRVVLPVATRLDTTVSIKGSGSEHVEGVDGAVDRLAQEIIRRLEQGRTLVVWAFDASGSLQAEREKLRKHIEEVYSHIARTNGDALDAGGLLTGVVSFGSDRKILAEPTADPAAIGRAIGAVGLDETGKEFTFETVLQIVKKYGKHRHENQPCQVMIIVVTDEIGDDPEKLEPAINACKGAKVPVFVLGSPAVFGRKDGLADYKDPKTGKQYYNLKVDQGPESAMLEGVRLPFWFEGPQYDYLDSGFGPYALSRLAGATGGIYFITRMSNKVPVHFDPAGMREYKPDWVSQEQYQKLVMGNPFRAAIVAASETCQKNLPGTPPLRFPPADEPAFKENLTRFQEGPAKAIYTIEEALISINQVAKLRDKETSRRWQAHYDLIRGRLLALRVRCYEYMGQCAKMKRDQPKFTKPDNNAWMLASDADIHYNDKAAQAAKEAETLLKRVAADHRGTPWGLLAERELRHPMGLRWAETYVPPPPKMQPGAEAAKKKAQPATPPPKEELPRL